MQKRATTLLVGNHGFLMDCVALRLERDPRLFLLGIVDLPADPTENLDWRAASIIIMDIDSAESNCFQLATRIRSRWPTTRLILIATTFDDRCIARALQTGIRALVPKHQLWQLISVAIDEVLAGGVYFPEDVRTRIVIDDAGASLGHGLPNPPHTQAASASDGSFTLCNVG